MMYQTLSARLRNDIRSTLGPIVLNAIQEHMYHKALELFDPKSLHWQTTDILELSELAHRLRAFAESMDSTDPVKLEAMRFASTIWNDYAAVYKIHMKRTLAQSEYADAR